MYFFSSVEKAEKADLVAKIKILVSVTAEE